MCPEIGYTIVMAEYEIRIKKKIRKKLHKLPEDAQKKLVRLLDELKEKGPYRKNWFKYSKLGKDKYHCHLGWSWVACWLYEEGTIII